MTEPTHLSSNGSMMEVPISVSQARNVPDSSPDTLYEDAVDVAVAERTFAELRRQLTQASSVHLAQEGKTDAERQGADATFDLLEYLRGVSHTNDETGNRLKQLGVVFENLAVVGDGGIQLPIITFFDALKDFALGPVMPIINRFHKPLLKSILYPMSGSVKSGEMCLVLGRPNSGCTTFLKVIANQRIGFKSVDGNVTYGGIPADVMAKRYKGEWVLLSHNLSSLGIHADLAKSGLLAILPLRVVYNPEEDTHLPTLTVCQTLQFALRTKTPGNLLPSVTRAQFDDQVMEVLLRMLGISHTKHTRAFLSDWSVTSIYVVFPAVSGNECQSAEMMATRACVLSWDNSTRGLDASTALSYAKSLRIMTNIFQTTTFVTLYQAGEGIYDQFDKVLLLNEGRCVYFGPTKGARDYMVSLGYKNLPRQTTADYLTGCTDENERQFQDGIDVTQVPQTPQEMEQAYLNSTNCQLMEQERMDHIKFLAQEQRFQHDFMKAVKEDQGKGVSSKSPYTVSIFSQLKAITIRSVQLSWQDRQTLYFDYLTVICMGIVQGTVFFNLPTTTAGIFTRGGTIFLGILMNIFLAFSGIPKQMSGRPVMWRQTSFCSLYAMQSWLRWIYYINPLSYAFAALMANEFGRVEFTCSGDSVVPRGDGYPSTIGPNQVCAVKGSRPGSQIVRGVDYMDLAFGFSYGTIWRNFVCIYWFIMIMLFFAVEKMSLGSGSPSVNVFASENPERKALNEKLQAQKSDFRSGKKTLKISGLKGARLPFTWEALSYDVPIPGGQRRLLNDIYGYVKPGTLTALMGSSGAGKTTLLDVLANRKTTGVISGNICTGGRKPGAAFQRGTAYCEQQDVHEWTATVREALRFSAYLRQPYDEKNAYVEEVIQLLELEDLADAMIGYPGFGLGVEARKRLTIGVELAARPELLLFLDEPTSGLDGQSAYNIVRFLRKLAGAGQAILCTIHQPNALLFENFDRLLLLKQGGRCVYFGDIGQDSNIICSYFARNGAVCPSDANPAEFMLEAIGAGNSPPMGGSKDWADRWLDSPEHEENMRVIICLKEESMSANPDNVDGPKQLQYATPFSYQLRIVMNRTNLCAFRNAEYEVTRVFNHLVVALITGLTYLNIPSTVTGVQYRVDRILQLMAEVEPAYIFARQIYQREASAKMYTPITFGISQSIAETPYSVACSILFFFIWYYLPGFQSDVDRVGYALLTLCNNCRTSCCRPVPKLFIAMAANCPLVTTFALLCGVMVTKPNLPQFGGRVSCFPVVLFRPRMYELNPFTRVASGLIVNEMHGLLVTCSPEEYAVFQPPSGQTCLNGRVHLFNAQVVIYLIRMPLQAVSIANTVWDDCEHISSLVHVTLKRILTDHPIHIDLSLLGIEFGNRYRDLGITIAFICSNLVIIALGSHYLTHVYAKR
ncbi:hypothetical protein PSHT_05665, partial [Puccinia striiformis]